MGPAGNRATSSTHNHLSETAGFPRCSAPLGLGVPSGCAGPMIYTISSLREQHTSRQVAALVADGHLRRAGRYYVTPDTTTDVRRALTEGLRPTCLTAAKEHELWVPPGRGGHAYGRRTHASAWGNHGWHQSWPEEDPVASPRLMLEHACRCLDPLHAGVLADSALRLGKLRPADVGDVAREVSRSAARVLSRTTGISESGTESKVRLFFQLHNVMVQPQVSIEGVGRVDLLVGRRWIIECDSRAHHTGEVTYEYDRARDLNAVQRGYMTTRLTYSGIFTSWDATSASLLSIVRSGVHLDAPGVWACR